MRLIHTRTGLTNLHVWRGGRSYERQKGSIYRREWNNLLFSVHYGHAGDVVLKQTTGHYVDRFLLICFYHISCHNISELILVLSDSFGYIP